MTESGKKTRKQAGCRLLESELSRLLYPRAMVQRAACVHHCIASLLRLHHPRSANQRQHTSAHLAGLVTRTSTAEAGPKKAARNVATPMRTIVGRALLVIVIPESDKQRQRRREKDSADKRRKLLPTRLLSPAWVHRT